MELKSQVCGALCYECFRVFVCPFHTQLLGIPMSQASGWMGVSHDFLYLRGSRFVRQQIGYYIMKTAMKNVSAMTKTALKIPSDMWAPG